MNVMFSKYIDRFQGGLQGYEIVDRKGRLVRQRVPNQTSDVRH